MPHIGTSSNLFIVTQVPHDRAISTNVRFWHKADIQSHGICNFIILVAEYG